MEYLLKYYFILKFFKINEDETLSKALSGEIKPSKEILNLTSVALTAKINE